MSTHTSVSIPIGPRSGQQYLEDLHQAIGDVLKLIFERWEIHIDEKEAYGIYLLIDLQMLTLDGGFNEYEA